MLTGEEKNLKDSTDKALTSYQKGTSFMSFTLHFGKANKLITALYMVTDIMDKEEPLRNKLRTLGVGILSDMHASTKLNAHHLVDDLEKKLHETLSFLDMAFTVGMISEMNRNILKKEFAFLKESIEKSKQDHVWIEEFLKEPARTAEDVQSGGEEFKGQVKHNVGLQKGSTLMKALRDIKHISNKNENTVSDRNKVADFNLLKNKRRETILKIIRACPANGGDMGGVSIKDIVAALHAMGQEWGEKTLQRELVSMVSAGVLLKVGEKRWSRYSIK